MTDYEVGYGKPPKHSQFKPGVVNNSKGRPKRKADATADAVNRIRNEKFHVPDRGRVRIATREELSIAALAKAAMKGDVSAAKALLDMRIGAERSGDIGNIQVRVTDWIPDYPGQTAEQKTQEFAAQAAEIKASR